MGDDNFSVEDMHLSGFLHLTRSRLLPPSDLEITCTQGKGSLIDYVLVSADLGPYASAHGYEESPFKTHACLQIDIQTKVIDQVMWKRRRPSPIPQCLGLDLPWGHYIGR
eukprot:2292494-Pyramimonas_sp.AAC.1